MNRKQFMQSEGATCLNWTWSWSFVDHGRRRVIFGLWDEQVGAKLGLILDSEWEFLGRRKQNGYGQAIAHIQLVENEGYSLWTFRMVGRRRDPARGELSPSAISKFIPKLIEGRLVALSGCWYFASLHDKYETIAELLTAEPEPNEFIEGTASVAIVNVYERSSDARQACIAHYGAKCQACALDFEAIYGPIGSGYIHVHHIKPIHQCGGSYVVNPIEDLIPVCANCHAMIHRRKEPLTVSEVKELLRVQKSKITVGA